MENRKFKNVLKSVVGIDRAYVIVQEDNEMACIVSAAEQTEMAFVLCVT